MSAAVAKRLHGGSESRLAFFGVSPAGTRGAGINESLITMKIGVFALQGAFIEHERALCALGAEVKEIRLLNDFTDDLDGVVLPGGESTVQGKLLREGGMLEPLKKRIREGLPVFGTCAGLILLADRLSNDDNVYLGTLNATVRRNAYGRQLGSFAEEIDFKGIGKFPAVFIRAPYVEETRKGAEVLAAHEGKIVAVRQGHMLATAFHPELTDDLRVHAYFLDTVRK